MNAPRLNLVVLRSKDIDVSARFYAALGLHFLAEQNGNGPRHYSAVSGELVLEIYPAGASAGTSNTRLGFLVKSLEEAMAVVVEAAGSIISAPTQGEWGRRAVVEDPDGHKVELVEAVRAAAAEGDGKRPFDEPMDPEDEALVAELSQAEIASIDAALLSVVVEHWRKLARVVLDVCKKLEGPTAALPYVYYARRVMVLVQQGHLESQGDLRRMRYSEVRLPSVKAQPVVELERIFLPALMEARNALRGEFPLYRFSVSSYSVGSLTDYQGHGVCLEAVFFDALGDEADNLALLVGLRHLTTTPEIDEASVGWGSGEHPGGGMHLLAEPVSFSSERLASIREQLPELLSEFRRAVVLWQKRGA